MSANGWPYEVREKSQLYRAGADSSDTIKTYMAMKKVSLKKEVTNIMDNLQEVERPAIYKECPKEYQYKTNGFKCNVDTSVMNMDDMKKLIASNVNR